MCRNTSIISGYLLNLRSVCVSVKRLRRRRARDRARRRTQTTEQMGARLQHDRDRHKEARSVESPEQTDSY